MNKTIQDELQRLPLPDPIRATANDIYVRLSEDTGTRRCTVRRKLIFFCVYNGYLENGEVPDPVQIAKLVGVSPAAISNALKHFSFPRTSYRIRKVATRPTDLLPQYARILGLREDAVDDLLTLAARCTDHAAFAKMMPQPVAAGVLRYYMELQGVPVDIDRFLEAFHITRIALDQAYHKVIEHDNT